MTRYYTLLLPFAFSLTYMHVCPQLLLTDLPKLNLYMYFFPSLLPRSSSLPFPLPKSTSSFPLIYGQ